MPGIIWASDWHRKKSEEESGMSLIIGAGYWTNGIRWIIFDSLHLRLPLNVNSSVLLSIFAYSPPMSTSILRNSLARAVHKRAYIHSAAKHR